MHHNFQRFNNCVAIESIFFVILYIYILKYYSKKRSVSPKCLKEESLWYKRGFKIPGLLEVYKVKERSGNGASYWLYRESSLWVLTGRFSWE